MHLHRVVGRRRRRCSAAATVAGVIAGVADVGLGDEEAGHLERERHKSCTTITEVSIFLTRGLHMVPHLENMWRRRGRRGETVARGVQNDAATAARSALQRLKDESIG